MARTTDGDEAASSRSRGSSGSSRSSRSSRSGESSGSRGNSNRSVDGRPRGYGAVAVTMVEAATETSGGAHEANWRQWLGGHRGGVGGADSAGSAEGAVGAESAEGRRNHSHVQTTTPTITATTARHDNGEYRDGRSETNDNRCDNAAADANADANSDADTVSDSDLDADLDADLETATTLDADVVFRPGRDSSPATAMHASVAFLARSRRRLAIAYAGLLLVAFTTSLEAQVTVPLAAFAVSSFENHSLLSTVYVVQGVVNAVIKPPMAKMADVFGRFEAFVGAVLLCVTGYVQMALSHNVQTFAAAQILYSAGITGLQVLQQILVADTTDLRHRALLSSLPDTPFLVTVWVGPSIAAAVLRTASWRWGYAMWAIILPLAFLPLAASLALGAYKSRSRGRGHRRCFGFAKKRGGGGGSTISNPTSADASSTSASSPSSLLTDLDIVGILLLSTALSLVLLPLTLAAKARDGWANPAILASVAAGLVLLLVVFPAWEAHPVWTPQPLIAPELLRSVTFCAGCGVAFFFFAVFYLSVQPYFYSYLLVAHDTSVAAAARITQTFAFTSTLAAVAASIAIRHRRRYKAFVVAGACVYLVGVILMLLLRTAHAGTVRLVATQIVVGLGAGLMSVPAQIGVQASVSTASASSPRLVAAATAAYLTVGEVGGAVGAAISGALWGRLVPAKLLAYLPADARDNAAAIYSSVVVATSYPWGSPARIAIARAYQEAMTSLLSVAVVLCVPTLLLALLMRDYHLHSHAPHAPHTPRGDDGLERIDARTSRDAEEAEGLLASDATAAASSDTAFDSERTILLSNVDEARV